MTDHIDEHEHRRFDEAAATWDDDPAKLELADRLAAAIATRVPLDPRWSVLDFGAGTGLLSVRLADAVGEIDMVDTSAGMLAVAAGRRAVHANLRAVHLDLTTEPAPRPHYDLITASLALHHVRDTGAVLDVFTALLTPGGWVAIAEIGPDPHGDFHSGIAHFAGHHGFDPAELQAELAGRGFDLLSHLQYGSITKEVDGSVRDFPVHLITGRAVTAASMEPAA